MLGTYRTIEFKVFKNINIYIWMYLSDWTDSNHLLFYNISPGNLVQKMEMQFLQFLPEIASLSDYF